MADFIVVDDDANRRVTIAARRKGQRTYHRYLEVGGNYGAEVFERAHQIAAALNKAGVEPPNQEQKGALD